jgi:clan AA aspartic protease
MMGIFRQEVEIINANDKALLKAGYIKESEVRQMKVEMMVDTGAYMICINEELKNQLGLEINDRQEGVLANGDRHLFDIAGPIEIRIHNRRTISEAIVLPGNAEPLLGSIPLEAMDLLVDPKMGQLVVPKDRPYIAQTLIL